MSNNIKSNENLSKLNLELSEISSLIYMENNKYINYIQYKNRSELFEWVLNISNQINIKDKTFFQAIEMFDRVIEKMNYPEMDIDRMKVFAIVCLMMSSKLEEVNFIGMNYALRVLSDNSSSIEELKEIEICILFSLNFQFPKDYFEEFSYLILLIFFYEDLLGQNIEIFQQANINLYKLILKNFEFFSSKDIVILYFAIVFFSLKKKFDSLLFDKTLEYLDSFLDLCSKFTNKDRIIGYASHIQNEFFN
jgi:hypothetical protein